MLAVKIVAATLTAPRMTRWLPAWPSATARRGSRFGITQNNAVVEVFGRDMVFLRDLGSTNGTYHNGRRTHVARMQPGDTVGVGKTVLKLEISR